MTELLNAIVNRRSYYQLSDKSPVSDDKIKEIISTFVKYIPSAFNSQSSRLVLLLGEGRRCFWDIVKSVLLAHAGDEAKFEKTGKKIGRMFRDGHGTVLFYEDMNVVKKLQDMLPICRCMQQRQVV